MASLHSETYAAFIRLLVEKRKASGLSQQDVADAVGWPQSFIAKIEKCERRIDTVEFVKVATAVGFDPARLVRELQKLMIERGDIEGP